MKPIISRQYGNLIQVLHSGVERVLVYNQIWAVLQQEKTKAIRIGVPKNQLKIKYSRL